MTQQRKHDSRYQDLSHWRMLQSDIVAFQLRRSLVSGLIAMQIDAALIVFAGRRVFDTLDYKV